MYVLSKRSPKRPPSGDDSACTSALVREMFPSCDGVALSEAPMNLYAAQKTHGVRAEPNDGCDAAAAPVKGFHQIQEAVA